mgnify:CR=1 FL=1
MFALPYTAFLNFKGLEINMLTLELCAYTFLGFGGALSGAFPLFLYRYYTHPGKSQQQFPNWALNAMVICLTIAFWSIMGLKTPDDSSFKKSLVLVYVVLFIPSLFPSEWCQSDIEARGRANFRIILYSVLASVITIHHLYQSLVTISDLSVPKSAKDLLMAGFSHPGQSGVFLDFVLCFAVCVLYVLFQEESPLSVPVLVPFVVSTLVLSLGTTLSLLMVYEELFLTEDVDVDYELSEKTE